MQEIHVKLYWKMKKMHGYRTYQILFPFLLYASRQCQIWEFSKLTKTAIKLLK